MCGIVGMVAPRGSEARSSTAEKMLDTIAHRGPDGRGISQRGPFTLGHVRLAVIDVEGSAQPMADEGGVNEIAFNGEIYNFQEIKKSLPVSEYRTSGDTEALLHMNRSGRSMNEWLLDLDGMYAFAMVGPDGLTLARDPLGVKPLYVGQKEGTPIFASEIKAIVAAGGENIREFPPGYYYTTRAGMNRFYDLQPESTRVTHLATAAQELLRLLLRSVKTRMLADVPVGVFLSGGLDSSIIAALARVHGKHLQTFSVGTDDSEDLAYAREVAFLLKSTHRERIFTIEEAIKALPEVIHALESFDCALVRSAVPNFFLAKLASEHVKVALSGEGADELFAGYAYLKDLPEDALEMELLQITRKLHNTNLQRCDRMSMAHGLEVRVPFLDDLRLIEYAFRISTDLKIGGPQRIEKWVLRRAAEGILPAAIVWRKKVKFAHGAGLGEQLKRYAESRISYAEFEREKTVAPGLTLRSREELMYYRIFREAFPEEVAGLVGRSRSV